MDRLRELAWNFWPLYEWYKNKRYGRGGWVDMYGCREVYCYDMEIGFGDWDWLEVEIA